MHSRTATDTRHEVREVGKATVHNGTLLQHLQLTLPLGKPDSTERLYDFAVDTFLEQSQTFMKAITESYHLVNTARAGLDLLAEQVRRIVDAGATDDVIEALYTMPNGATGQNLRAHALRTPEEKERDLAEMWLMTVFARYESWAESLTDEYHISNSKRGCQFPEQTSRDRPGYIEVFSVLQPSQLMEDIYGDTIRADRFWIPSDTDAQHALRIYRYYKEIRNSLVHSNGKVDEHLAIVSNEAYNSMAALQLSQPLRSGSVSILSIGDPIEINFQLVRNVIDLLHRLVFTIDARILTSTTGLDEFIRRWREKYGLKPVHVLPQKLTRPSWFSHQISDNLKMPYPIFPGNNVQKWPESSRKALSAYCTSNWMISSWN